DPSTFSLLSLFSFTAPATPDIYPLSLHDALPICMAKDVDAFCKEYDQIIKDNPIDIQLLGIGRNGHIAFNEPGTPFNIGTHEVKLTENTIKANARFFDSIDEVPKSAICMGTANIMQSKKIVLMAFGEKKAHAIKKMIEGKVT